jgi:hypothetical protein
MTPKEEIEFERLKAETRKLNAEAASLDRWWPQWMTFGGTVFTAIAPLLAAYFGFQLGGEGKAEVEQQLTTTQDLVQTQGAQLDASKSALASPSTESFALLEAARLDTAIVQLYSNTASARLAGYDTIVNSFPADPQLVSKLLAYAEQRMDNENGIYNTLVVLSHVDLRDRSRDEIQNIRDFAQRARAVGSRTSARVDTLLSRLPAATP